MTVFPTASHLVSWPDGPQVKQSAGKRKGSNAAGRGNPTCPQPSAKSRSAPAAPSRSWAPYGLAKRMRKRSLVATGNSVLTSCTFCWPTRRRYTDLGADYYEQRMHVRRQARNHVRSLERLGYKVTSRHPPPAPTTTLTAAG